MTRPVCPSSVATVLPVAASHSRAVLSSEPVRTRAPSGEKATAQTGPVCPSSVGDRLARRRVPQPRRLVLGAGEDARAVGREGDSRRRGLYGPRAWRPSCPSPRPTAAPSCRRSRSGRARRRARRRQPQTGPVWPSSVATVLPVAASHSRAVLSSEPVRTRAPSGEKATAATGPVCPSSVATGLPVAASHSRAVLSPEPVRTRAPSGEKATPQTRPVCPSSVATGLPVAASHSRAVLSSEPVRTRAPSGEKATAADGARVSLERGDRLARRRVPQPRRLVLGAGQDARAVGREGDGRDAARVALERGDRLARRRVPQPRRLVVGAGQDARAVGREGDGR